MRLNERVKSAIDSKSSARALDESTQSTRHRRPVFSCVSMTWLNACAPIGFLCSLWRGKEVVDENSLDCRLVGWRYHCSRIVRTRGGKRRSDGVGRPRMGGAESASKLRGKSQTMYRRACQNLELRGPRRIAGRFAAVLGCLSPMYRPSLIESDRTSGTEKILADFCASLVRGNLGATGCAEFMAWSNRLTAIGTEAF